MREWEQDREAIQRAVVELRLRHPLDVRVITNMDSARCAGCGQIHGDTWGTSGWDHRRNRHVIRLRADMPLEQAQHTMWHELWHCVQRDPNPAEMEVTYSFMEAAFGYSDNPYELEAEAEARLRATTQPLIRRRAA